MKIHLHCLFAAALFSLGATSVVHADPESPMFGGSSLTINGTNYSWQSASEDGTNHYDFYESGITVSGRLANANLATVSGSGIDGYLSSGSYADRVQQGGGATFLSFNGREYGSYNSTTTYTINLDAGQLSSETVSTFSGLGWTFTVAADGTLSGSESGFYIGGIWYVNGTGTPEYSPYTSPEGRSYDTRTTNTTYSKENGAVVSNVSHSVSGPGGTFTVANRIISGSESGVVDNTGGWHLNGVVTAAVSYNSPNGRHYSSRSYPATHALNAAGEVVITMATGTETYSGSSGSFTISADGVISGSESGYVYNGQWHVNYSTGTSWPILQGPTRSQFGNTLYQTWAGHSVSYDATGNATSFTDAQFHAMDGAYLMENNGAFWGWDPHVGSWSATYDSTGGGLQFADRGAPKFLPTLVLWVNGTAVNWQSSVLQPGSSAGDIIDTYSGGEMTVVVTGFARAFDLNSQSASVTVSTGGGSFQGSVTLAGGLGVFSPAGVDVQVADPNRTAPLFSGPTLYVDGTPFAFDGGYQDSTGNRTDTYSNTGNTLRMIGLAAQAGAAQVNLTMSGEVYAGSFTHGVFTVSKVTDALIQPVILPYALLEGPPAFWVAGSFYLRTPNTNNYATTDEPQRALTLSGEVKTSLTLAGAHTGGVVASVYNAEVGGVFRVTVAGVPALACPAEDDGRLKQGPSLDTLTGGGGAYAAYSGLPPGVKVPETEIWAFLGIVADETAGGGAVACYGNTRLAASGLKLLKIHLSALEAVHDVTLHDYAASGPLLDGSYDRNTHLFQTLSNANRTANAATAELPYAVQSVDPGVGDTLWRITPADESLPVSFIVHEQPWWYAGIIGGLAVYRGFYDGQEMTLGPADATTQARQVVLRDLARNGNTAATYGSLSDVRRSVRLRDGTLVLSGNGMGLHDAVNYADDYQLQTIRSDVDIIGNNLSFGLLTNDASLAGALFQFADSGGIASLHSILSRPQAEWLWNRAASTGAQASLPVMKLESDGSLHLFAADHAAGGPAIVLTPNASETSHLSSRLEVSEDVQLLKNLHVGGDLSLAGVLDGDIDLQGDLRVTGSITSDGEALLTQTFADTRYHRSDAAEPLAIANGVHITGATQLNGALSATGTATMDGGATITGAMQLNGTLSATDAVIMDGGATITGATQLNGTLTATGSITANAAARFKGDVVMESGLVVRGVYDGPPEDNKVIMQAGQSLLIPESGDISMGIFRAGPLPETVPVP